MSKKKLIKWLTDNFIALSALIFSIIVFANDCSQRSQIEEIETRLNALNFRPQLIVDNLKIKSIQGELKSIERDSVNNEPALVFNTFYNIEYQIELLNTGNTNASVIATAWTDTIAGHAKLRSVFNDQKSPVKIDTTSNYYLYEKVVPQERYYSTAKRKVQFLDDDTFTVHFLILYENDLGIMYDTYYWARYKVVQQNQKIQFTDSIKKQELKSRTLTIRVPEKFSMDTDIIAEVDSNTDYKIYSEEERAYVLSVIQKRITK
ncbi:MAG: hypothetical protein KI791_09305 [Cyclobacteriaceae bacterium]|nr:hypothetical protein [Cyclobacteriaceae bacterium SS2]